jgi:hypothetical protein
MMLGFARLPKDTLWLLFWYSRDRSSLLIGTTSDDLALLEMDLSHRHIQHKYVMLDVVSCAAPTEIQAEVQRQEGYECTCWGVALSEVGIFFSFLFSPVHFMNT